MDPDFFDAERIHRPALSYREAYKHLKKGCSARTRQRPFAVEFESHTAPAKPPP